MVLWCHFRCVVWQEYIPFRRWRPGKNSPSHSRHDAYTTNIIEGLNRQFRKITKNKPSFTNDDSLKKMLYLASAKITGHWTARCRNWDVVSNYLNIMFGEQAAG